MSIKRITGDDDMKEEECRDCPAMREWLGCGTKDCKEHAMFLLTSDGKENELDGMEMTAK
jgi:hypothetical protein